MTEKNFQNQYPLNLIYKIYEISPMELLLLPAYSVSKDDVDEALSTLTERERKVLELRYKCNKTLREVASHFAVTSDRIKQIEDKAFRKLRHPSCIRILNFKTLDILERRIEILNQENLDLKLALFLSSKSNNEVIDSSKYQFSDYELEILKSHNIFTYGDLKTSMESLIRFKTHDTSDIRKAIVSLKDRGIIKQNEETSPDDFLSIEEIGLSVRTENCLKRYGINTVYDFKTNIKSYDDLKKIRNLGRKSADEILTKLSNLGYDVSNLLENDTIPEQIEEKLSVEEKLYALKIENEMLKGRITQCAEMLTQGIEK